MAESYGFLTDALSNPWVSLPLAVGEGAASVLSPWGLRGVAGLNSALRFGLGAEQQKYEQERKRKLGEALNQLVTATQPTEVTKSGVDLNKATLESVPANTKLSQVFSNTAPAQPLPTFQTTENTPIFSPRQQEFLKAISGSYPEATLGAVSKQLFKEPAAPHVFGSPQSGYFLLDDQNKAVPLVPGKAPETKPLPAPHFANLGGENVQSVWNPGTQQWDITRTPSTPAPPRQLSPEDRALKQRQMAVSEARVRQINEAIKIAGQAKTQTVGQLGSALNALRAMELTDLDPDKVQLIKDAQIAILEELAARKKAKPGSAETTPGGKPPIGSFFGNPK